MEVMIPLIILGVLLVASYFASARAYRYFQKKGNKYPRTWQVAVFLLVFIVLSALTCLFLAMAFADDGMSRGEPPE